MDSRPSGLPRPQSRLPTLRPTSQIPRPASPEAKSPEKLNKPLPRRASMIVPPSRTSLAARQPLLPPAEISKRQPTSPSSRPQSKHDSGISLTGSVLGQQLQKRASRHTSQENGEFHLISSPESDKSSSRTNSVEYSPTPRLCRPRPSLSDRTLESLSSIPQSPAGSRNSSFFGVTSPTASPSRQMVRPPSARPPSARPPSALGTVPKARVARPSSSGFRAPSPVKAAPVATPAKRVSTGLGIRSALPTPGTHKRTTSTIRTTDATPVTVRPAPRADARARPVSMASPRKQPEAKPQPRTQSRMAAPVRDSRTSALPSRSVTSPTGPAGPDAKPSSTLRAQIAKAKAAHRQAAIRPGNPPTYSFEGCEDPFGQGSTGPSALARRVDKARVDGRLNIAALDLTAIPDEVLHMYSSAAMEASSVPWNETVDLVKFIAADNEIQAIDASVFPDKSVDEFAEGAGNQFGGIELLDLHGNLLASIPIGLRRLEQLTVLNLARNKLDNAVWDVIAELPRLRELHLNDNELARDVPDSLGFLASLEVLHLENNKLTSFPGSVRNLDRLRVLNLSSNRFAELPIGSIFSLPGLREVYAGSNALTGAFFPMTVDIVRSLQTLDISNNSLASISFGSELHLPAVTFLNVSRNRLFGLPKMSSWANLLTLLAEENGLSALPEGFTALRQIKVADFARNSLRAVDEGVANMASLETLGLAANPLREKRLLGMTTGEVKAELRRKGEVAAGLAGAAAEAAAGADAASAQQES